MFVILIGKSINSKIQVLVMNRRKLYEKSVTILCNAYSKGTLDYDYIKASAIGNLIAANLNYSIRQAKIKLPDSVADKVGTGDWRANMIAETIREDEMTYEWVKGEVVIESSFDKFFSGGVHKRKNCWERAMKEIDATRYSIDELNQIEYAFQDVNKWGELDGEVTLIAGLIAAINALRQIHQVPETEESLPVFKNLQLQPSEDFVDVLVKRFGSLRL